MTSAMEWKRGEQKKEIFHQDTNEKYLSAIPANNGWSHDANSFVWKTMLESLSINPNGSSILQKRQASVTEIIHFIS